MNAFELALRRISKATSDMAVELALDEAVSDALPDAADLVTEQLTRGEYAEGHKISPDYVSDEYARIKNAVNPEAGLYTPDLKAEGDFHDSIYAEKKGKGFAFDARDAKWRDGSLAKYKDNGTLLGLQDDSLNELMAEQIEPAARDAARVHFTRLWNSITK